MQKRKFSKSIGKSFAATMYLHPEINIRGLLCYPKLEPSPGETSERSETAVDFHSLLDGERNRASCHVIHAVRFLSPPHVLAAGLCLPLVCFHQSEKCMNMQQERFIRTAHVVWIYVSVSSTSYLIIFPSDTMKKFSSFGLVVQLRSY